MSVIDQQDNQIKLVEEPVSQLLGTTFDLDLDQIDTEGQVRKQFSEEEIKSLAQSISNDGQRSPLEVAYKPEDKRYLLITGERRLRALQLNQAAQARVTLIEMPADKQQRINLQLVENIQREDLTPLEIAAALKELKNNGLQGIDMAQQLGKSRRWVSNHLQLNGMPGYITKLLEKEITTDLQMISTLRQIHDIEAKESRQLVRLIKDGRAGRKQVDAVYKRLKGQTDSTEESAEPEKQDVDLDAVHYSRPPHIIKSDNFIAQVEAKLENGTKVSGELITTKLVTGNDNTSDGVDHDWCWIAQKNGKEICVKTSTVRIKQVSSQG